ncbi:hypothetical protein Tco_0828373 [Tanacetum coccineum]
MLVLDEIYKFSDGTLHQIDEALDYRVKEFKVNMMNSDLNTWFWTRKDVKRIKEFVYAVYKKYLNLLKKELMVRGKLRQLPSREYRDRLQIANMDKMTVPLSV